MRGSRMAQVRWLVAVDTGGAPTDAGAFGPDGAPRAATGLDPSATEPNFLGTTAPPRARFGPRRCPPRPHRTRSIGDRPHFPRDDRRDQRHAERPAGPSGPAH